MEKDRRHYLRAEVDYFDFVTGLIGKLTNGPQRAKTKFILHIWPTYDDINKVCHMDGALFECCQFLSWVNGTYDAEDLRSLDYKSKWAPEGFKSPEQFTYETWKMLDNEFKWQLVEETTVSGVKWLSAKHSGDGGDRCCAGITTFSYEDRRIDKIEDGPIIEMPSNTRYPAQTLIDWVKQGITTKKFDKPEGCSKIKS